MPVTAGILDVICGASGILMGIFFLEVGAGAVSGGVLDPRATIIGGLTIPSAAFALAGSVFAFKRKKWILALIGAIAALGVPIPWMYLYWREIYKRNDFLGILVLLNLTLIPGIVAIVLTMLSRKQFERK